LNALALVRFSKQRHFTASQYFLPIKRTSLYFRVMKTHSRLRCFTFVGPSKNSHIAISDVIVYPRPYAPASTEW
jgi:hypothetical protein